MSPTLSRAIEAVTLERPDFRAAHSAVQDLVAEHGEAGLADFVVDAASSDVPADVLADVLGISCWCGDSNGSLVARDLERWLKDGSDKRRIEVALSNPEFYPFRDPVEMIDVLTDLSRKAPESAARCAELIAQRRQEGA